MSRRNPSKTSSRDMVGKKPSTASKPSIASKQSIGSKPSTASARGTLKKPSATIVEEPKKEREFKVPALSIGFKPKVTESELQKMRKRTIRRHAPPGEDIKQINQILNSLKRKKVTVHEFISLIAPSTSDRGETLRLIMQDDLNSFRKLARKVYETVTQDNSDVLLNQQLQLSEFYKERKILLNDRMMKLIEEIYLMAPNFDFDRYSAEKEKYLLEILPPPKEIFVEPEEMEMMKRQAAYHRLQWLRSEGERLNDENNSLKKRLNQLKRMHREEQAKMMQMEHAAEAKKEALEATQAEKVETLEKLSESLEKSMIDNEKSIRESKDQLLKTPGPDRSMKKRKSTGAIKKKKRPDWMVEAAKEVERQALAASKVSEMTNTFKQTSPFHYSPPSEVPRQTSPFHYSPPPEPPRQTSPFHYSPPAAPIQETYAPPPRAPSVQPQPQPQPQQQRLGRRPAQGPRDSWGGFY